MRTFGSSDFWYILQAAQWTVLLSIIAFIGGGLVGLAVALARTGANRALRTLATGFIKVFQGTPLLLQLFLVFFGAPVVGFEVDPWTAAAVALTLNAGSFLGEIWRGCIEAIPHTQWEASDCLGLNKAQTLAHVILPQAFRIAIPPTVGFLVQIVKNTSYAVVIGFFDLTYSARVINNSTFKPFVVFTVAALIYFALCYPLSILSYRLERKLKRHSR